MKNDSLRLSQEELTVLSDKNFMPLKNSASEKVLNKLNVLRDVLKAFNEGEAENIPDAFISDSGRISKGENHHSYAYRVLDYPGLINRDDIFLFRTLLLWGHHFAFYLILKGKWKIDLQTKLRENVGVLKENGIHLVMGEDAWEWLEDIERIESPDSQQAWDSIETSPHLKLVRFLPLNEYESLEAEGLQTWKQYLKAMGLNFTD